MKTNKNTGITLPRELHLLLRNAARSLQNLRGGTGRASVSHLLATLIEAHRVELESLVRRTTA
jgi:hypothetical protein